MPKGLSSSGVPYHNVGSRPSDEPDSKLTPFQEWLDSEIYDELWDQPIIKDRDTTVAHCDKQGQFVDYQVVHLPPSLAMCEWKRLSDRYPGVETTIFIEKHDFPDLKMYNEHILVSEFMRSFISALETLWFLGNSNKFTWEFTSSSFRGDCGNLWRPWLYIYSKNKIMKGNPHLPVVNKSGKYVVRLFWLGAWRKIYVDDMVPIDKNEQVMLPFVALPGISSVVETSRRDFSVKSNNDVGAKKISFTEFNNVIEMWPFLLCKALIKVAGLTWTCEKELLDFDIIQCLTGWIPHEILTKALDYEEVWNYCMKYTDQYEWPEDQVPTNKGVSTSHSKQIEKPKEKRSQFILMAGYEGKTKLKNVENDVAYTKCNHTFLIYQTRDKQLIKPSIAADFPLWKRYRWLEWAAGEGIISPLESQVPIKCLSIIDAFRDQYISRNMEHNKETEQQSRKLTPEDFSIISTKSEDLKGKLKKTASKRNVQPIEQNFWMNFGELYDNLLKLIVYYRPSGFHHKINVSDAQSQIPTKKSPEDNPLSSSWTYISYPLILKLQRNEPLFIFTDSLINRELLLNLSQMGCVKELEPLTTIETKLTTLTEVSSNADNECGYCLESLLERYKVKKEKMNRVVEEVKKDNFFYKPVALKPRSNIVIGKYDWRSDNQDRFITSLTAFGSSSVVLNLKPGRHIFRMYLKSDTAYTLLMLSQDVFHVCDRCNLFTLMREELHLLNNFCSHIYKNFDVLVQSFGKKTFNDSLRVFYKSCKPESGFCRADSTIFHDEFFAELFNCVCKTLGEEKENHLKIFFRQWQKPLKTSSPIDSLGFCYDVNREYDSLIEELQSAAVKIQAFFRGLHDRYLLHCHNPANKDFKKISDSLSVIKHDIFSEKTGMLPFIFRQLFKRPSMINIAQLYPFFYHIDDTINYIEVSETSCRNSTVGWIVISIQTFHVVEPMEVRVNLFCDLPEYFVRVFNNDTRKETKFFTNNAAIETYTPTSAGYTTISYGISKQALQYSYKLLFVFAKNPSETLLSVVPARIKSDNLLGNYIPNAQNLISRSLLKTHSEITVATIKFTTSFRDAKIHLQLLNSAGQLYNQVVAQGEAIMPLVILEGECVLPLERSDSSRRSLHKKIKTPRKSKKMSHEFIKPPLLVCEDFIIEANILDNSWPLTAAEWNTVSKLKLEMLYKNRNVVDKSSRKRSFTSFEQPYWMLQIFTKSDDKTQLRKDRQREEEIMEMKTTWFGVYPGRYEEAQKLRQQFLQKNLNRNDKKISSTKIRSLDSRVFKDKILPDVEFSEFENKHDSDVDREPVYKTEEMQNEVILKQQQAIDDFQEKAVQMTLELNNINDKHKETYNFLNSWFQECRNESAQMMADAEREKAKYVQKVTDSAVSDQKKTEKSISHRN